MASIKTTLLSALNAAISWEESLLDADAYCNDKRGLKACKAKIRRYQLLMDRIDKNRPLTLEQYLDEGLKSGALRMVTLEELKESI